jgi:hypothetical protein
MKQTDIDLDLADRNAVLKLIQHIPAHQFTEGKVQRHSSGVYVTNIPFNPVNQCAAIDYESAEKRGYFKLDFLNMSVYQLIKDQAHYDAVLSQEPDWSRLWIDREWAKQVVHIGSYISLLQRMKPDSIPRMAAFISIIRPGKAHLQDQTWDKVFAEVWDGDSSEGYTFKKSHSIGYSMLVALHMNLLSEQQAHDSV